MTNKNGRFGIYGGQYIPETLMNAVIELEKAYNFYKNDENFNKELNHLFNEYAGRPSRLYFAEKMTNDLGGAKIYLKREDLNHTGAHKINNVLGQSLLAKKMGKMNLEQIREILKDTFKELNFDNLIDVKFVGDGTYLEFTDKFIEIRPSGTDAKTKAYGAGASKDEIKNFARIMGNYSGNLTALYEKYVDMELYKNSKELSLKDYALFTNKDANNAAFTIPDYSKTLVF